MRKFYNLVWLFILFFLSYIVGELLLSGNIVLYLSPRMKLSAGFGFVVLVVLLLYQLKKIFTSKESDEKTFRLNYLLFFIPIFLFFTSTPDASTINTLPNRSVELSYAADIDTDTNIDEAEARLIEESEKNKKASESNEILTEEDESDDLSEERTSGAENMSPCILTEGTRHDRSADEFQEYLYYGLDEIMGNEVTMLGFIYKDETLPEDTILIARYIISCCVADASVAGYPVKVENADDFEEDEWIEVTGKIDSVELNSYGIYYDYPIITDGTIIKCDTPSLDEAYIYP